MNEEHLLVLEKKFREKALRYKRNGLFFLLGIILLLVVGVFAVIFSRELARVDRQIVSDFSNENTEGLKASIQSQTRKVLGINKELNSINKKIESHNEFEFGNDWLRVSTNHGKTITSQCLHNGITYLVGVDGAIYKLDSENKINQIKSGLLEHFTDICSDNDKLLISSLSGKIYSLSNKGVLEVVTENLQGLTSISVLNGSGSIIATTLEGFYFIKEASSVEFIKISPGTLFNDAFVAADNQVWLIGNRGALISYDFKIKKHIKYETSTSNNLYSISSSVNEKLMIIVGSNGTILYSENSGNRWSLKSVDRIPTDFYSVTCDVVGKSVGISGADGTIVLSNNGIANWKRIPLIDSTSTYFSIHFNRSDNSFQIAGENGIYLKSSDLEFGKKLLATRTELEKSIEILNSQIDSDKSLLEETVSPLKQSQEWLFHLATNTTRIAVIVLIIFLVKILLNQYNYNQKLSTFYDSRADTIVLFYSNLINHKDFIVLFQHFAPDKVELGPTPTFDYPTVIENLKK